MSKKVEKMELDALTTTFSGVRDLVILSTTKVQSELDYSVRKTLRDKKIKFKMVKNTLARKVLGEMGISVKDPAWSGPTIVAWGADSIKDLSKGVDALLKDIVKKNPKDANKLIVKTAVADGQECKFEDAMKMPTRLEAIGEIVSMILGPGSAIAGCLTAPGSQVASLVEAVEKKAGESAPETAEVAPVEAAPVDAAPTA